MSSDPRPVCDWCDERFFADNGQSSEDGKRHYCSDECFEQGEQDFDENEREQRFQIAYYEATRGC